MQTTEVYNADEFELDGTVLVKYKGDGGDVRIPDGVETIAEGAFKDDMRVTGIALSDSVRLIREGAFKGCKNLRSVAFGEYGLSISDEAFFGCESLSELRLPREAAYSGGTCYIGDRAFSHAGIRELFIPKYIRSIGKFAFEYCDKLTSIEVDEENYNYKSDGNCILLKISIGLFECLNDPKNIVLGCKTSVIPSYATGIDNGAFRGCAGLEKLSIPKSVTRIGGCVRDGFVSAYEAANPFAGCENLREIQIEQGNPSFKWDGHCLIDASNDVVVAGCRDSSIPDYVANIGVEAFAGQTALEHMTIPASVTQISERAFAGCVGLKTVELCEGVRWINTDAFEGCASLEELNIPKSVTSIGWRVFAGCGNLKNIRIAADNAKFKWEGHCLINVDERSVIAGFEDSVIPEGVTSIETGAFKDCVGLKELNIPGWVTDVGTRGGAFEGCKDLVRISLPDGIKNIAPYTFRGCVSLEEARVPSEVTDIGYSAFEGCARLAEFDIPDSVREIQYDAFKGCVSLESVVLPSGILRLNRTAFEGCDGLQVISLPEDLKILDGTSGQLVLPSATKKIYY